MKKILLALLLALVFSGASAQKAYQKLSTFKGDTVAYMRVNFEENKSRYIGYNFEKLLNDYELPLRNANTLGTSPWDASYGGKAYLNGFMLSYLDLHHFMMYKDKKIQYANVIIYFRKPYTENEYDISDALSDEGFTKMAIIKRLGGYVVEKITVVVRN